MEIINVGDTFKAGRKSFGRCVILTDVKNPGIYNLCKSGRHWELYYTDSSTSQPVLVIDDRVEVAMKALLEWHKLKCNNCEAAPKLCDEAQHLLAHI